MSEQIQFARQTILSEWGPGAQESLHAGRVLVVGLGGLGSWVAELLARAGVGFLRLVDDELVDLTNIHRQGLYCQRDATDRRAKADVAAERLRQLNEALEVEPILDRVNRFNLPDLAADVQLIIDGTDNFATRFLINDYCVRERRPWVFAGVVRAEGQVMAILPGRTPCLRCVLPDPPPVCIDPSCREVGVLGPAVSAIASLQALEAMKILGERLHDVSPFLLKVDLWQNVVQQVHRQTLTDPHCPCCGLGDYEYLEP